MRLLLLGATGLVGSCVLEAALSSEAVSEVIAPTRTPLPPRARLVNPISSRIEEFAPALRSYNFTAVVCALGTTQAKAGSKTAFRYVDYELPVVFAEAAYEAGVRTYAIVTAMGASVNSMFFYSRTKGEVEKEILKIGFPSLTICRPSLIHGERKEVRIAETAGLALSRLLAPVLPKKFHICPADAVARALLNAVINARNGCNWIYAEDVN